MPTAFADYYRCAADVGEFGTTAELRPEQVYSRLHEAVYYGRRNGTERASYILPGLQDISDHAEWKAGQERLPFDLSEVVGNLRLERYGTKSADYLQKITTASAAQELYYFVRPLLPVSVRRHLQKAHLRGWDRITFPRWPVDFTVETLMEHAMTLALRNSGGTRIPFIWFWPNGAPSGAIMTHDVEGPAGRDFCDHLMDLDESFGIAASFQVVPEVRYEVSAAFLERFRSRGFEVNVHDLNHDGRLFQERDRFLERAAKINQYAKKFQSRGFRAGAMYRQQDWFDAFDFSYDMSVPNVAHLEPQRGGCCTVMPYFVGKILELPLTTIQDYSLFHILGDYSIGLWKTQIDLIRARNGLISFITHPDYLIEQRAQSVYVDLLKHLRALKDQGQIWLGLPGEVDRWWRSRSQMTLVQNGSTWCIDGPDRERARLAYATLEGDRLVYEIDRTS